MTAFFEAPKKRLIFKFYFIYLKKKQFDLSAGFVDCCDGVGGKVKVAGQETVLVR